MITASEASCQSQKNRPEIVRKACAEWLEFIDKEIRSAVSCGDTSKTITAQFGWRPADDVRDAVLSALVALGYSACTTSDGPFGFVVRWDTSQSKEGGD